MVAVVMRRAGLSEGWDTLQEDLMDANLRAHHGVWIFRYVESHSGRIRWSRASPRKTGALSGLSPLDAYIVMSCASLAPPRIS